MKQSPTILKTLPTRRLKGLERQTLNRLPETDAHLGSQAHKEWRGAVIKRAGGKCEWPGCDRAEPRMFADHIVERKDGGAPLDLANGQCLCGSHHTQKTLQERAKRMAQKA